MSANSSDERSQRKSHAVVLVLRGGIRLVASLIIVGAILFPASGGWDWGMAWVTLGVLLVCVVINVLVLMTVNPEVIATRLEGPKDAKPWDLLLASAVGVLTLLTLLLAGLDHRFGWSPRIGLPVRIAALAVMVLGDLLFLWAMAANRFFAKFVRIQREQGHQVVTAGPYRYVRHPGYVGWIMMWTTPPLVLGSVWALIPTGLSIALIVVRTALEDRTLKKELRGYAQYAVEVRYRLLPGIW